MVLPSVFVLSLHKSLYFFISANPLYLKASPHLFKEMPLCAITNPDSLLQNSHTYSKTAKKKPFIFKEEEYKNALLTATLLFNVLYFSHCYCTLSLCLVLAVMFFLNFMKSEPVSSLYQTKQTTRESVKCPHFVFYFFTISVCLIMRDIKYKRNAFSLMLME